MVPMRGLGVAAATCAVRTVDEDDGDGAAAAEVVAPALAMDVSAIGLCAIVFGAVPCPWRSSTLPRGAAAGRATRTASAPAAPIRT